MSRNTSFVFYLSCLALATGCPSKQTGPASSAGHDAGVAADAATAAAQDFDATASDFECLSKWTKVRSFYITNKLDALDQALAVAHSADGGVYPAGTIIQLVPQEAMVKRRAGFSAETGDWEFFSLRVSATGTTIVKRGTGDVTNAFNGNCKDCHGKAEPKFDFVCEQSHGCAALQLTPKLIDTLQSGDARCQ